MEERKRGEQSQESPGEQLFPLHARLACSIAHEWLREKGKIVPFYFWEGIMLSMASPFSSSTMSLTPSTTSWTCATSEEPRRSALEMSNTPPTEAVSTPPVPRFCRRSLVRISSNLACVLSLGSLTWTPPRRPVPRLE